MKESKLGVFDDQYIQEDQNFYLDNKDMKSRKDGNSIEIEFSYLCH